MDGFAFENDSWGPRRTTIGTQADDGKRQSGPIKSSQYGGKNDKKKKGEVLGKDLAGKCGGGEGAEKEKGLSSTRTESLDR